MSSTAWLYLHPLLGVLVLSSLTYTALLGVRSRGRARNRARLLARHARVAPLCFALVALTWLLGLLSVVALRDDLHPADSTHFALGSALLTAMAGGLISSRRALAGSENARELHVWFGVAAVLLGFAQAVTGLRITP